MLEFLFNKVAVLGALGERIYKPVQFDVIMEMRWKLHCKVVSTHVPT